ncbi:MAG: UPF0182 family protein [Actinobacteria bacterium]|nr:UPF0182 family protein [Actinomycetota bacterium]
MIPTPAQVWRPLAFWITLAYTLLVLAALPPLIVHYWFLESLGKASIFWTNFATGLALFLTGIALFSAVISTPFRTYASSPTVRKAGVYAGLWIGVFAGWLWSTHYEEYLLAFNAGSFGEVDPLFGHDIGFYVFVLPAVRTTRFVLTWLALLGATAAIVARFDQLSSSGIFSRPGLTLWSKLGLLVTNGLNGVLLLLGSSLVANTFLARYGLLFKDNDHTGVRTGAAYVDVEGFFSTLNIIYVSTFVELGIMGIVGYSLYRIKQQYEGLLLARTPDGSAPKTTFTLRRPLKLALGILALDLTFFLAVVIRNHVFVAPNEPTIQIPYIERHIAATTSGYRLDNIETIDWRPPQEPLSAEQLLESRTVQNAPLLPTWVSYLEEPPDVQHYERIEAADSTFVYGPMLQVYAQEQQLRPYYRFISVDGVRYHVDGEKRMYVSAVRELPSLGFGGPRQWLRHWGSAALMFTHGLGLVMSPVNELDEEGGPRYTVWDIPPRATHTAFDVEPRIYFGEGARDDYILTNIRYLKELDFATGQSRKEFVYPPDVDSGISVDSVLKRVFLALDTRDFRELLFSRFIDHQRTRIHLYRTPFQRVRKIAPFLFLDSNIYAFIADKNIVWMVNGLTTTDNYPYSFREVLGDKADERAVEQFPERTINYAEDSVKITVDAYSGDVHFYKIADDPIINTWERVYPGLFEPASAMPVAVEAQLTYPLQWFHIQFDDIYKRYHQRHPIEFYNSEDLWDDADEVVGSIGRGLTEFGTTDQMTFSYEGYNFLLDPADLPAGSAIGEPGDLQYTMLMPFTPEGARNLRSLVLVFQDPGSYGKLLNLRIPQGVFIAGPEQADALIDADAQVNQQITLWVRHGSEVVRGHTLLLPVGGDLIYVEPLWINSLQNQLPQIKLLSVVYRGRTTMGTSLNEAIRRLEISEADEQKANELPWFNEAQAQGR